MGQVGDAYVCQMQAHVRVAPRASVNSGSASGKEKEEENKDRKRCKRCKTLQRTVPLILIGSYWLVFTVRIAGGSRRWKSAPAQSRAEQSVSRQTSIPRAKMQFGISLSRFRHLQVTKNTHSGKVKPNQTVLTSREETQVDGSIYDQ